MARFSIVVPAYNASSTIRETLDAVRHQEFADWECIIVDDGSTDATAAIAREYEALDSRFRLLRQDNSGTAGAYNAGVRAASGGLLVLCSADDYLLPRHLRVMDETVARNQSYDIFSSNGQYLVESTRETRPVYTGPKWQEPQCLTFEDLLEACFYGVGAVFRRAAYDEVGGFRAGAYVEDYDLWLRMMANGSRHMYVPETLSVHRISSSQKSAAFQRVMEADIEALEHLLSDHLVSENRAVSVNAAVANRLDAIKRYRWEQATGSRLAAIRVAMVRLLGEQIGTKVAHLGAPLVRKWRSRRGLS